jgi:hypothetical protein
MPVKTKGLSTICPTVLLENTDDSHAVVSQNIGEMALRVFPHVHALLGRIIRRAAELGDIFARAKNVALDVISRLLKVLMVEASISKAFAVLDGVGEHGCRSGRHWAQAMFRANHCIIFNGFEAKTVVVARTAGCTC